MPYNRNILLLTGHRKSGTTMFSNLFDGHNDLIVYPSDLCLLYAYYPYYSNSSISNNKKLSRIIDVIHQDLDDNVKRKFNFNDEKFNLNKLISFFKKNLDINKLEKIDYVINCLIDSFLHIAPKKKYKYIVIKETSVDIYANEFFKWFPKSKIIQLVRDPRDNYASLKSGAKGYYSKIGEDEKKLLASLINRAKLDLEYGIINKRLFKNKYNIIKYESLTKNSKKEMLKVCKFLKIKYDNILLTPTVLEKINPGNNFEGENFIKISSKNVNKWEKRINPDEAKIIEFYFKDLMKEYGYKLKYSKVDNYDFLSEYYKWTNYEYFFHNAFKNKIKLNFK